MKALILAGGDGTRLWPVSRKNKPKQVQPFIDEETLLQKTYNRISKGFKKEDIFISIGENLIDQVKSQLPDIDEKNLIIEPVRRNRAPAIGLAALILHTRDPKSSLVTIWADNYIKNVDEYLRILKLLNKILEDNPSKTALVGVKPTYPETGYGYIKMDSQATKIGEDEIFKVEKFVEKPDLETAKQFVQQWDYLWNPGIFSWKTEHLLNLYKKFLPDVYKHLETIKKSIGTDKEKEVIEKEFTAMPSVEIEEAILEKSEDILVAPASFGWSDIGHWKTIQEILTNSADGNVVKGENINIDSSNNLIYSYSGKLIATAGVNNMIIIETDDVILVCPKDKAQDVKKIVGKLKEKGMEQYL
jgi:mannose-1-phosphate guanylyltransferase